MLSPTLRVEEPNWLIPTSLTRWYHCMTPHVFAAFLLGEGDHNRKEWLENRLQELADIFKRWPWGRWLLGVG